MIKTGALVLILVLCFAGAIFAGPTCRLCGKPVEGSYIKFGNNEYSCLDCQQKYAHCDQCRRPSPSLAFVGDKKICSVCMAQSARCGICGEPILGQYTKYPEINLTVCEKCMNTVPKCDFCGRPDKNLVKAGRKNICLACAQKADLCYLCRQPIVGQYVVFEGNMSRKYCQACVDKYHKCSSCGAPVGLSGFTLEDGRQLCSECYSEGLFRADQVAAIKAEVLEYLSNYLAINITHKITYTLQGEKFIKEKSNGLSGDLNGLFYRKGDSFEIYVLYGLRRNDMYQVQAHEIAHAWMSENAKSEHSLEETEGFAQWVSYHLLGNLGLRDQQQLLLDGDNIYANGLRKMLQIEKERGQRGVLTYVTN
jgi:hypothetical protein